MKKNAVGMIKMLTQLGSFIGKPHIKGGLQVIAGGALIVGAVIGSVCTSGIVRCHK